MAGACRRSMRSWLTPTSCPNSARITPCFSNCKSLLCTFTLSFYFIYSLDREAIIKMIEMVTKEPEFNDMPARCFTLPFVATECFCTDIPHFNEVIFEDKEHKVMEAFFAFVDVPEE